MVERNDKSLYSDLDTDASKIESNGLRRHRLSLGDLCALLISRWIAEDQSASEPKSGTTGTTNRLITKLVLAQRLAGSSDAARRGKCCAVRVEYFLS